MIFTPTRVVVKPRPLGYGVVFVSAVREHCIPNVGLSGTNRSLVGLQCRAPNGKPK